MKYIAILKWRIDDDSFACIDYRNIAHHYNYVDKDFCVFHLSKIRRIVHQIQYNFIVQPVDIVIQPYDK